MNGSNTLYPINGIGLCRICGQNPKKQLESVFCKTLILNEVTSNDY